DQPLSAVSRRHQSRFLMKPAPRDGSIQRYVHLTGAPQGPIGHHPPRITEASDLLRSRLRTDVTRPYGAGEFVMKTARTAVILTNLRNVSPCTRRCPHVKTAYPGELNLWTTFSASDT